jgi:hypothetical protein
LTKIVTNGIRRSSLLALRDVRHGYCIGNNSNARAERACNGNTYFTMTGNWRPKSTGKRRNAPARRPAPPLFSFRLSGPDLVFSNE